MNNQDMLTTNTLVKHLSGSHSYGTNVADSDVDYRGIFWSDPINIRTPFFPVREISDMTEEDTKLYELSHFMKLCTDNNPNVIETLWIDPKFITHSIDAYTMLRDRREDLLCSSYIIKTVGYANAQLHRMKSHNKWITKSHLMTPPKQCDYVKLVYNFTESKVLANKFKIADLNEGHRFVHYGNNIYGVYPSPNNKLFTVNGELITAFSSDQNRELAEGKVPKCVVKFNSEVYDKTLEETKNYKKWKRERNEKRSALEEAYGYDTKHAMHLMRLLNMGIEAANTGQVNVWRSDAEYLLDVRNGKYTYEQIIEQSDKLYSKIEDCKKTTKLRKSPNYKLAAELTMDVQDLLWRS